MSVVGRAVDGATDFLGGLGLRSRGVASRPAIRDLERKLADALKERAAAEALLEQAEAEERDLAGASVDDYLGTLEPGEYDRRRADVERRLVETRANVQRWSTIAEGVREKAIEAVEEAVEADCDAVTTEREKLQAERERLARKLAGIDRADAELLERFEEIRAGRLPALARFDAAAAEQLAAREKARDDEAVQLAHARIRGEDVDVPADLAALVREHEPLIRADLADRQRRQLEHFRRIGTVQVAQHGYDDFDPDGARRDPNVDLGFSDPED